MKKSFHAPSGGQQRDTNPSPALEEPLIQPLDARRVPSASAGGLFEVFPMPDEDDAANENGSAEGFVGPLPVAESAEGPHAVSPEQGDGDASWVRLDLENAPGERSDELPLHFEQLMRQVADAELFPPTTAPMALFSRVGAIFHPDPLDQVGATKSFSLSGTTSESLIEVSPGIASPSGYSSGEDLPVGDMEGNTPENQIVVPQIEVHKAEGRVEAPFNPQLNPELSRGAADGLVASASWAGWPVAAGTQNPASSFGIHPVPEGDRSGGADLDGEADLPAAEHSFHSEGGHEPGAFLELPQNQGLATGSPVASWANAPTNAPMNAPDLQPQPGVVPFPASAPSADPGVVMNQSFHGESWESHGPLDDAALLATASPNGAADELGEIASADAPGTDFLPLHGEPPKPGWGNLDTVGVASVLAGVSRPFRRRRE